MICKKCGAEFSEGIFCPECGTKIEGGIGKETAKEKITIPQDNVTETNIKKKSNALEVWSLILGISGMVFGCMCIGVFPSIIGLILAIVALVNHSEKKGLAIAGLITSVIGIVLALIVLICAMLMPADSETIAESETVSESETEIEYKDEFVTESSVEETEESINIEKQAESTEEFYAQNSSESIESTIQNESQSVIEDIYFSEEELLGMPIYSLEYLSAYMNYNGIELPENKNTNKIVDMINRDSEVLSLKASGNPVRYAVTNETSNIYYVGDTKKNRPHGWGRVYMLVEAVENEFEGEVYVTFSEPYSFPEEDEMAMLMVYVGEFDEGYYSGYGWEYILPNYVGEEIHSYESSRDLGNDYKRVSDNLFDNVLLTCNPIGYMGEFKKGLYHGDGVRIDYAIRDMGGFSLDNPEKIIELFGCRVDREIGFYIGEYEKGYYSGEMKEYLLGKLSYSGEMKKDMRHGKGTQYYLGTDQIEYEGEWKNDEYHGKGTLYDEDGSIIYEGEWEYGDYAH